MLATKFAVAVHIMLLLCCADWAGEEEHSHFLTSARLGASVDTNPVVIRRITGQLARAGLVRVHRGRGGAELGLPKDKITLADIWHAIYPGETRRLLPVHPPPTEKGAASATHAVIDSVFAETEAAFRDTLDQVLLATLADRLRTGPPPTG